ncbi:DNA-binding protein [Comamonas piscis]
MLGISLERVEPSAQQAQALLAAADRNIADSKIVELSEENQFDAAYKAIMQLAMLGLMANGYRTLTSKPGHHQTAIQTLALTVQWPSEKIWPLDALRKQRNLADYSGDLVSKAAVDSCLSHAMALRAHVQAWLLVQKPDLLHERREWPSGAVSSRC